MEWIQNIKNFCIKEKKFFRIYMIKIFRVPKLVLKVQNQNLMI